MPSDVTIVVPCFNEEQRLSRTAFLRYLDTAPNVSFLFVNDGSRDGTLALLNALAAQAGGRVQVLNLPANRGKAEAVRQGLRAAAHDGADHIGYWDADLATPLDAIDDFIRVLDKFRATQVVFGARRQLLGHRIRRTPMRRAVSFVCAALARQAIRLPVGDTQCGAKLLRNTPNLRAAIATPFTAGWLFDVELFARLSANLPDRHRAFYEQPLMEWQEVAGSKVSAAAILRSGLHMLWLIVRMRLATRPTPQDMPAT
ncbi:hypothetical protein ACMU_07870 [Actibacterium mucosum KCTC 23349]|uniref:Glycosyltransferase 2-like domain-containing protein n=2 Tax=Actibacterium TaxID=1433986 RepID=A0A037ZPT5_9RHOB|nr:hypothetical protein ACMU_07870 [Actibacterium mucosum KCTC 23349]